MPLVGFRPAPQWRERERLMNTVLLIILILLLIGALPTFGFHPYGYGPSGLLGVVVIILIVLLLTGRL
jgi:Protein of unknown function (DUF3309)